LFQITLTKESLIRNPDLRLFKPSSEINSFKINDFEDNIQIILESKKIFRGDEKLIFLHNLHARLCSHRSRGIEIPDGISFSNEQWNEMVSTSMSYIISYLTEPSIFSQDNVEENMQSLEDCSSKVYDLLYDQTLQFTSDDFLKDLISNTSPNDYKSIFIPILKRIFRSCKDATTEHSEEALKSLELF